MILRRVIEHVKAQNWTAVALDFVIVVMGVFIGVQASNWNAARVNARQAASFTERLRDDMKDEAWIYHYLVAYYTDVLASAERAQALLGSTRATDNEAFLINAYRASQYTWWYKRRAAFDEIVATGRFGDITDAALRGVAMQAFNSPLLSDIEARGRQSRFREAFRMTIPTDIHRAIGDQCGDPTVEIGDYAALKELLSYRCSLDLPQNRIDEAAMLLRANPEIAPALRLRIATLETQLGDLKENNQISAYFDDLRKEALP